MLSFPARFFVEFFDKHGFLNVDNRPVWQAVKGGSREYMRKLAAPFAHRIRLNTPVTGRAARCRRASRCALRVGSVERFDHVFFACHSDQALRILQDAVRRRARRCSAPFPYQENEAVLHTDERLLPRTPLARAAWNYHLLDVRDNAMRDRVALTYDMNVLQSLDAPVRFLVTLNRTADIDPAKVLQDHHLPSSGLSTGRRRGAEAPRRDQRRQPHVLLRRVLALRLPRRRRGQRRVGARGFRARRAASRLHPDRWPAPYERA